MTVNVGVIGIGNIGTEHARRLDGEIAGARVAAVCDVDRARADRLGGQLGATVHASAADVVDDPAVDAVVIASPGEMHADAALDCIAAGKPVLCEKPLATTVDAGLKVLDAEVAHGRRLLAVGFMRRYDPAYRELKRAVDDGLIGEPLLLHCVHRNAAAAPTFTSEMAMTDSVIHEIDAARWLLGAELVAATVVPTRRSPLAAEGMRDPQLVLLEAANGAVVDVEVFVGCQYGYEVRCEAVGATGTASLGLPPVVALRHAGAVCSPVHTDWRDRFGDAYRLELQDWVNAVAAGATGGPSAWDGYAATAVAEACVSSLAAGERVTVGLAARPALYGPAR